MGSGASFMPDDWAASPPSVMDIVAGYFPETKPKGALRLRPCLVTRVLQNIETGEFACELAFGTKNLKVWSRTGLDVIVQNTSDLDEMGLAVATRFVLDAKLREILPWQHANFGCWTGRKSPRIGTLPLAYQKDYAFAMMKQLGA